MRVAVQPTEDPNAYSFEFTPDTPGVKVSGTLTRDRSGLLAITCATVEADDVTSSLLRRIQYGEILIHARYQVANLSAGGGQ